MSSSSPLRIALVTGANKGLGKEISRQLAQQGIRVIMAARDPGRLEVAHQQLRKEGLEVDARVLDVTRPAQIKDTIQSIQQSYGRLDILVNNAGVFFDGWTDSVFDLEASRLEQTLAVNVFGPLALIQAVIPLMKAQGYGRIVNMSSTLGSIDEASSSESAYDGVHAPAYRMSKTLLNSLTVLTARELRDTNVLVNSVCPGWVKTDMGTSDAPLEVSQGADTPVWLATLPDDGPRGGFYRERTAIAW